MLGFFDSVAKGQNTMKSTPFRRLVSIVLLSWLSVIGFDFLLHASILAPLYAEPSQFLLPPDRAFALIPLGYLSFLISTVMLVWLTSRLGIDTWRHGFIFGLILGALIWGSLTLSLLSITTAGPILMLSWFLGMTIETGIAGLVAGAGFGAQKLKKLLIRVLLFTIGSVIVGVVLQSI